MLIAMKVYNFTKGFGVADVAYVDLDAGRAQEYLELVTMAKSIAACCPSFFELVMWDSVVDWHAFRQYREAEYDLVETLQDLGTVAVEEPLGELAPVDYTHMHVGSHGVSWVAQARGVEISTAGVGEEKLEEIAKGEEE